MMQCLRADDFIGDWRLTRAIKDHFGAQNGTLEGRATFVSDAATRLAYHETGQLRLAQGPAMTATRRYLWDFTDASVAVFFEDGRPFHDFIPQGHAEGTDHPCGADYYTVRYDFTAWPRWVAQWTVKGPAKDYVSTSVYTR